MIQMYELQSFGKRQLGVTHNLKYMTLFRNVAKLIGKKGPSIRIEGSVFYLLFGLIILPKTWTKSLVKKSLNNYLKEFKPLAFIITNGNTKQME
jgi:hypothetical protein